MAGSVQTALTEIISGRVQTDHFHSAHICELLTAAGITGSWTLIVNGRKVNLAVSNS